MKRIKPYTVTQHLYPFSFLHTPRMKNKTRDNKEEAL